MTEIIIFSIIFFILGVGLGIYLTRFIVKREFAKNPPISEEMIGAMLKSMGQPATQKRINSVMKSMRSAGK